MSAIAGILNLDGAPVEPDQLQRLAGLGRRRGPDGIGIWSEGRVGLIHFRLDVTPEEMGEEQPLESEDGRYRLSGDLRLDNPEELKQLLKAKGWHGPRRLSDARLLLAIWGLEGEKCLPKLLGDFSIALWDRSRRTLLLALDRMGSRSLCYRRCNDTLVWSTQAAWIVGLSDSVRINERMVACDLALPGYGGERETYFEGIYRLMPGERLLETDSGVSREQYWELGKPSTLKYGRDEDYAAHFREVFSEAVRCRLRSARQVGLFMSGGLDSSSIAACATDPASRGSGAELLAAHWTFNRTPEADESELGRLVASHCGLHYREFNVDDFWPLYDYPDCSAQTPDEPFSSHMYSFHSAVFESLGEDRPRVWMTGGLGDYLVGGHNPFFYSNLLAGFRLGSLARTLREHRRAYGISTAWLLSEFLVAPLFTVPVRRALGRLLRRGKGKIPGWVEPGLARRTGLPDWVGSQPSSEWLELSPAIHYADRAKDWRYRMVTSNHCVRFRIWTDSFMRQFNAVSWAPWDDVRVLEYILAIPEEKIARGIDHKLVLRQAMEGLLPDQVRERRGPRMGPGIYIQEGLRRPEARAILQDLFAGSVAAEMGYIDLHHFRGLLADYLQGRRDWSFPMWMVVSLEIWLRRLQQSKGSALPIGGEYPARKLRPA